MRGDNLLIVLEQEQIPHFVIRSHIYAPFDDSEYRSEYHIYHLRHKKVGCWNKHCETYDRLNYRKLSRLELKYFHQNIHKYTQVRTGQHGKALDPKDGKIWINNTVGFKTSLITKKQAKNEFHQTLTLFPEE